MDTEGLFSPASVAEAREWYETAGASAQEVVKETARAMAFDAEEYDERVTGAVIETARDALFASLLRVRVGDRPEYESWLDDYPNYEAVTLGSEDVSRVVWHAVPFADTVVAATFENEPEAAVSTLRRQAFGRVYREHLDA